MTNTTKPELLPCPFCGSERISIAVDYPHGACADCGTEGPFKNTRKGAVETWNTRATQWHPITNIADKFTPAIVNHACYAWPEIMQWLEAGSYGEVTGWHYMDGKYEKIQPTHFMPLFTLPPKAPEVE